MEKTRVKVLLALTAAVLLTHWALLRSQPLSLGLSQPPLARAFITRAIEPPRPKLAETKPARTPVAPPQRKLPAPVKVKVIAAAETLSSNVESPPPRPTINEAPETPLPLASLDEAPTDDQQPVAMSQPPRDQLTAVGAVKLPGTVVLKYQVATNKFPFSASAELRWQQDGEGYDTRLVISAFGQARIQTSRGQVTPEGLAPIRFSDKFRSEVAAHFNREMGKVTFSANTPDVPLLAGAQDRLSVLVQLGAMIAGDPGRYPQATTLAIQTIGPRDADTWLFTVGTEETLTLPGGTQATLKLVRNPREEFDQKVELWLAPALGYLPARIRITEPNGDFIDQQWLATEPPH